MCCVCCRPGVPGHPCLQSGNGKGRDLPASPQRWGCRLPERRNKAAPIDSLKLAENLARPCLYSSGPIGSGSGSNAPARRGSAGTAQVDALQPGAGAAQVDGTQVGGATSRSGGSGGTADGTIERPAALPCSSSEAAGMVVAAMSDRPEGVLLRMLRWIDSGVGRLLERMGRTEQQVGTAQLSIGRILEQLDRIERRLEDIERRLPPRPE